MRWILTAALVPLAAFAAAGCSSQPTATGGESSCAARITWNGRVYFGQTFAKLPPATLLLGTGGRPTCRDAIGGETGASQVVEVRRMIGVDPRVAVAVKGERDAAYLAPGYFVPSHPLHRAIAWTPRSLDELAGCATRRRVELRGTVGSSDGAAIRITRDGRDTLLFVDAETRFEGLERNGIPYVPAGRRIAVDAVECLSSRGSLRKIVPRRIAPA